MLQQDLNSEIKYLLEQELKENEGTKKKAGTSIEINSILVPAQFKFCCNIVAAKNTPEPDFISLSAFIFFLIMWDTWASCNTTCNCEIYICFITHFETYIFLLLESQSIG